MEIKELEGKDKEIREVADQILEGLMNGHSLGEMHDFTETDMEAVYSMAYSFYKNGKHDKADSAFRFLCFYDHLNPRWWVGLGANKQMQNDYEGAVKAYAFATVLDVENPKPQLHAGYCLIMLGQYSEAIQALEGVIIASGNDENNKSYKDQATALLQVAKSKIS